MVSTEGRRAAHSRRANRRAKRSTWEAAEDEVRKLLAGLLLDGCLVLNDVPFPYGNLDHVVIRADGTVFLVETKSHRGKVTWNSNCLLVNNRPFRSDPICQVNRSIRWMRSVARRLFENNPWIVAVLAFPNALVCIPCSVKKVNVMHAKDIPSFIRTYGRATAIRAGSP